MENHKINSFLSFLQIGLQKHSEEETQKTLGDRSTYIGGSDLGMCPRKAILSKFDDTPHSLREHIVFGRGHIAEQLIANALKANCLEYTQQMRVESKEKPYLKAHLDFVIHSKSENVMLEIKTVSSLPTAPRESWMLQVQYGLGLLRESGVACNRGYIVCIDVNSGDIKLFPFDFYEEYYKLALERAEMLYKSLKGEVEAQCETSPLCAYCSYSQTCPNFGNGAVKLNDEIQGELQHYIETCENLKQLEAEKKKIDSSFIGFMQSAEIDKIKIRDKTILLKTREGRVTFDAKAFQEDYPDLHKQYVKAGSKSVYLSIV